MNRPLAALAAASAPYHSPEDFFARARARLSFDARPFDSGAAIRFGDHTLNDIAPDPAVLASSRAAAVLVGVVVRGGAASVILTLRASTLRDHSGQTAFPGGKIDAGDASPLATALREAQEEIGLDAGLITPLGYLDPYLTGTGFRVLPVLARVSPDYALTLDPGEVAEAFEVPLSHLMDPENQQEHQGEWKGVMRRYLSIACDGRKIWGATAGMVRNLHQRLYL